MSDLRPLLNAFGAARDGPSRQAFACFSRAVAYVRLRRVRFGALGLSCDDNPNPTIAEVLRWPGAAAFPGAARVELPARGGLAQELPIGHDRAGAIVLALPALETVVDGDTAATAAVDIVWCDPREPAHWARATGLSAVLGDDPEIRLMPDDPVRLHATPLSWFRAVAAAQAQARRHRGCVLLDPHGDAAERLLLGPPLICDDAGHAAVVETLQRRARARALRALPKPGRLLLARSQTRAA